MQFLPSFTAGKQRHGHQDGHRRLCGFLHQAGKGETCQETQRCHWSENCLQKIPPCSSAVPALLYPPGESSLEQLHLETSHQNQPKPWCCASARMTKAPGRQQVSHSLGLLSGDTAVSAPGQHSSSCPVWQELHKLGDSTRKVWGFKPWTESNKAGKAHLLGHLTKPGGVLEEAWNQKIVEEISPQVSDYLGVSSALPIVAWCIQHTSHFQ